MQQPDTTSWRVIRRAAAGAADEREEFVRRYSVAVRAYLGARWRGSPLAAELDDAVQEVFVECFRQGGVLEKAEAERPGGFRAYFYGVVRNVALRVEQRAGRAGGPAPSPSELASAAGTGESLSAIFDKAWARAVVKDAAARYEARARAHGGATWQRYELLHLRFQDGLPIREIARLWGQDAAFLHHEYAAARKEFEEALREAVALRHPGSVADQERVIAELIDALG